MPETTTSSHIFLSYARKDVSMGAAPLDAALKPLFPVWRDTRGIDPARDFTTEIENAIEAAQAVVVCVTPDVKRGDSFVRRELAYADYLQKPILVARFDDVPPPINVFTRTWLDFFRGWDAAYDKLITWLKGGEVASAAPTSSAPPPPAHPMRRYVQGVLDSTNKHLETAIIKLIDLEVGDTPDAVPAQGVDVFEVLVGDVRGERTFANFGQAFQHYEQRALLLGEPGAGKTVTLMATARQAAADWLTDSAHYPLPLLHLASLWDAQKQPSVAEWLGGLKWANAEAVRAEVQAGRALLLLDGLDEMGSERMDKIKDERTGEEREVRYDPRQRFIAALNAQLGANKVLVTCRIADYEAIGAQVALEGAVTLQKLTDAQMRAYLAGDELAPLQATIDEDEALREMARTPLLLSYLAFAFRDRPEALRDLKDLREGALRDAIFNAYIDQRYAREAKRLKLMGKTPLFTLDFIRDTLGRLAMENAGGRRRSNGKSYRDTHVDNVLERRDFDLVLAEEQIDPFISECLTLHFLARRPEGLGFIHLKLRDTLVYEFSMPRLRDASLYTETSKPSPAFALAAISDLRAVEPLLAALRELGDARAIEPLIDVLTRTSASVSENIVVALRELGDARAIEPLIAALKDVDAGVRASATSALREFGDARAIEPLIAALKDSYSVVRRIAADALGDLGDACAVDPLIAALKDADLWVRSSAAFALGNLGRERAAKPLLAALTDEDADKRVRNTAAFALGKLGEVGFQGLLTAIEDADPEVSDSVASALRALGESGFQTSVAALKNIDAKVRGRAAEALGLLGDARASEALLATLKDADASVRSSAISALGKLGDARAVEPLIAAFKDEDTSVRRSASYALSKIGEIGFQALLTALNDADEQVRRLATDGLGNSGDPRSVEPLLFAFKDADDEARSRVAYTLGELRDVRALEPLLAALKDSNAKVRNSATTALGKLSDVRAVPHLIPLLQDTSYVFINHVCDEVAFVLERLGTPEALEAVRAWRATQPPRSRPPLLGSPAPRPQPPVAPLRPFGRGAPPPASPPVEPPTPPPDDEDDTD